MKKTNGRQNNPENFNNLEIDRKDSLEYGKREELQESDFLDSELLAAGSDGQVQAQPGMNKAAGSSGDSLSCEEQIDELGAVVKKIRLSLGMTQGEVAKALNVTPGYISNVENNRTAMSLRVLVYYAMLTNTTLDTLVGLTQSDYQATALDNDILRAIAPMDRKQKEKLLETLRIWT